MTEAPASSIVQPLKGDIVGEIKGKIDFWHTRMTGQLYRFNTYADFWRLVKPSAPADLSGFANPQLTETTRATEAIATFLHRALTSQDPNFQFSSYNPDTSQESLWQSEQVVKWQKTATQYNRKLLRALRSMTLFGTVGVEEPWVKCMPYLEATDFVPRSLLQMAFDPVSFSIDASPWHASLDFVAEDVLIQKAKEMPNVFDGNVIQQCIGSSSGEGKMTPEMISRLAAAGYYNYSSTGKNSSKIHYLVTYYGPLSDNPTESGRDWCVSILDDMYVIRAHESSYPRRPFEFASLNEFEMEPYGYGVGRVAEMMQPEMNANRGRMHDTITFSLFNMWVADRMSNIKTSQLKARPWGVVEIDGGTKGLEPIRPQLEGVNFGIQLENLMKGEFRGTVGATDNLQAMVTEGTATETSIAQNEAVRRLSVIAETGPAEGLLRRHFSKMHENNLAFLDQPFWLASTGQTKRPPTRIYPGDLAKDVEVQIKVITDKDFRPQRNKDLLQLLQMLTSIRSDHPEIGDVRIIPIVQEICRGVGINPATLAMPRPPMGMPGPGGPGGPGGAPPAPNGAPPNAIDQVGALLQKAEAVRARAGELGANAHKDSQSGYSRAGI